MWNGHKSARNSSCSLHGGEPPYIHVYTVYTPHTSIQQFLHPFRLLLLFFHSPPEASRRFTCLVGIPERHQSSRGGGTESTSLSSRVHLLRPAMSNSAAEMSGASKKVFRAHPRQVWRNPEVVGATKKVFQAHPRNVWAQPRNVWRNQESFSGASKSFIITCLVHSTGQSQAA